MPALSRTAVLQSIGRVGIIPVVRVPSVALARQAVAAIQAGGISIVEITMTIPGAVEIIEDLTKDASLLVGAGTVLDSITAGRCVNAGAAFIVTPVLVPSVIAYCQHNDIAMVAGALTPTEIFQASALGADLVKVFPAHSMGGPSYLRAVLGPLPQIKLVPTGGVSLATAQAFLEAGAEAIGIGSELIDVAALRAGRDHDIIERAKRLTAIVSHVRTQKDTIE
jgi:2-dehydro-3-deoxyphosphogluconate aldolase/(4S)-4-hydroxy-2-oxoglutarate aldolase